LLFTPKAITLYATMSRGRRGFVENIKGGLRALKYECPATYFANECRVQRPILN